MLHLTKLRDLTLRTATSHGRAAHLSSASGLVWINDRLYVVADDELQLGIFTPDRRLPGSLLRLFPGELPDKPKPRKKRKPDLEVLVRLPTFPGYVHGALLALGSGSTARRCRGALLPLDSEGQVQDSPYLLDASAWFGALRLQLFELNLEGAWCRGEEFCLLQRGNKGSSSNAVIRFHLRDLLSALQSDAVLPVLAPQSLQVMELGEIDGVPLCFSDACSLPDGHWLFTAVAEDVDSAYADGAFLGAAIGMVDAHDRLVWLKRTPPQYKIEGIDARAQAGGWRLLLVTDADDPDVPAALLSAEIASG